MLASAGVRGSGKGRVVAPPYEAGTVCSRWHSIGSRFSFTATHDGRTTHDGRNDECSRSVTSGIIKKRCITLRHLYIRSQNEHHGRVRLIHVTSVCEIVYGNQLHGVDANDNRLNGVLHTASVNSTDRRSMCNINLASNPHCVNCRRQQRTEYRRSNRLPTSSPITSRMRAVTGKDCIVRWLTWYQVYTGGRSRSDWVHFQVQGYR
jgi:hypothetical protein